MRIGVDATPILHGERAVRRNSRNLLKCLTAMSDVDWRAFYIDRKGDTVGRLGLVDEVVCRIPTRLLQPAWQHLAWPTLEGLVGEDMDLFYAPDLYFPPARHTTVLTTIRGVAYLAVPEHCAAENVNALKKALAYSCKHADYFLAVSESTKQDLLSLTDIPENKIFVSSHGIDSLFTPIDQDIARAHIAVCYGVKHPFFLFVGAIASHKNVRLLVDALQQSHLQNIDLVLAGPHELHFVEALRAYIKDVGLLGRVHLIGSISQEGDRLVHLYSAAIGFLFPSFYEGWCAPPLEAMACGTAVIASSIPSLQEVTGDAAVLLPVDDAAAWCVAMERIVEDSAWQQSLVGKGLQHIVQHSWKCSAERLLNIMQEIVGREP